MTFAFALSFAFTVAIAVAVDVCFCYCCCQEDQRGLKSSRGLKSVVPQKLTKHHRLNDSFTVAHGLGDLFNFVTGSAAKVQILLDEPANGLESPSCSSPFKVIVVAEAQSELKYNKVYLKVRYVTCISTCISTCILTYVYINVYLR